MAAVTRQLVIAQLEALSRAVCQSLADGSEEAVDLLLSTPTISPTPFASLLTFRPVAIAVARAGRMRRIRISNADSRGPRGSRYCSSDSSSSTLL